LLEFILAEMTTWQNAHLPSPPKVHVSGIAFINSTTMVVTTGMDVTFAGAPGQDYLFILTFTCMLFY
jgi:hypothetical protein